MEQQVPLASEQTTEATEVVQTDITVVRGGTGASQTFTLRSDGVLRIGRGVANDIVLDFNGVSVYHAELVLRPDSKRGSASAMICVRDDSKNGTGVRPGPHAPEVVLKNGALPPWESVVRGALKILEHGWQLMVPMRSRKGEMQQPEIMRMITVYHGSKVGPTTGEDELDGEVWDPASATPEAAAAPGTAKKEIDPAKVGQEGPVLRAVGAVPGVTTPWPRPQSAHYAQAVQPLGLGHALPPLIPTAAKVELSGAEGQQPRAQASPVKVKKKKKEKRAKESAVEVDDEEAEGDDSEADDREGRKQKKERKKKKRKDRRQRGDEEEEEELAEVGDDSEERRQKKKDKKEKKRKKHAAACEDSDEDADADAADEEEERKKVEREERERLEREFEDEIAAEQLRKQRTLKKKEREELDRDKQDVLAMEQEERDFEAKLEKQRQERERRLAELKKAREEEDLRIAEAAKRAAQASTTPAVAAAAAPSRKSLDGGDSGDELTAAWGQALKEPPKPMTPAVHAAAGQTPMVVEARGNLTPVLPAAVEARGNLTPVLPAAVEARGNLTPVLPAAPVAVEGRGNLTPAAAEARGNLTPAAPAAEVRGNLTPAVPQHPPQTPAAAMPRSPQPRTPAAAAAAAAAGTPRAAAGTPKGAAPGSVSAPKAAGTPEEKKAQDDAAPAPAADAEKVDEKDDQFVPTEAGEAAEEDDTPMEVVVPEPSKPKASEADEEDEGRQPTEAGDDEEEELDAEKEGTAAEEAAAAAPPHQIPPDAAPAAPAASFKTKTQAELAYEVCVCGAKFVQDARFCRACGRKRPPPPKAEPAEEFRLANKPPVTPKDTDSLIMPAPPISKVTNRLTAQAIATAVGAPPGVDKDLEPDLRSVSPISTPGILVARKRRRREASQASQDSVPRANKKKARGRKAPSPSRWRPVSPSRFKTVSPSRQRQETVSPSRFSQQPSVPRKPARFRAASALVRGQVGNDDEGGRLKAKRRRLARSPASPMTEDDAEMLKPAKAARAKKDKRGDKAQGKVKAAKEKKGDKDGAGKRKDKPKKQKRAP